MKKILVIVASVLLFAACDNNDDHTVTYFVTRSESGFDATFIDENGLLNSSHFTTQSAAEKKAIYSCILKAGDIVYMSVKDTAADSYFQAKIFIDGKVYKEASRSDDKTMPVTLSGNVPYDE